MFRCGRLSILIAIVALAGLAGAGGRAAASSTGGLTRLTGHVLPALAQATGVPAAAASSGNDPITLTLVLNRADQPGFDAFLAAVQDPRSAGYGHFLTQPQLADRFGPSQSRYAAVLNWLQQQGFSLSEGSVNRLTLTVTGTRAQAERAFAVQINDYDLNGTHFYANDRDPMLPAAIAPDVQTVVGLNDLARPSRPYQTVLKKFKCLPFSNDARCPPPPPPPDPPDPPDDDPPDDTFTFTVTMNGPTTALRAGVWVPATGLGQKIGLLEFGGFNVFDVADYLAYRGLPATLLANLSVRLVGGAPPPGPGETEVLVDIDTALTIAQDAQVVVYSGAFAGGGTSFQAMFNAMVGDGMSIISNSFNYCEDQTTLADVLSINSIFGSAAAAGTSVFNAAGDFGSTCADGAANTINVPSDAPNAIAVGGTRLHAGNNHTYGNETWWNTPPNAGGFGTSRFFPRPTYQNGISGAPMRSVPDVVAQADPATGFTICEADAGGCPTGYLYGGTSMAAPLWAAWTALINQSLGANLGNIINSRLYPLANTSAFHNAASMGSDFAHVGLGSPNLIQLFLALSLQTPGPGSVTASTTATSFGTVGAGSSGVAMGVFIRDAHGNTLGGKHVTLNASSSTAVITPGSAARAGNTRAGAGPPAGATHARVTPLNGITSVNNGAALFIVSDPVVEDVVLTATDTDDGFSLPPVTEHFASPNAVTRGISVDLTTVPADGTSFATITVTLQDKHANPAPGKTVTLAQGNGHSNATSSGQTNASGQATFQVTDKVTESVTYTASDESDRTYSIPGSVSVNFTNGSGGSNCPVTAPVVALGYAVTTFVTGFPGCRAPFGVGFDAAGSFFVTDLSHNHLLKFGPTGGTITAANLVASYPSLPSADTDGLAFGNDGKLYVALLNSASVWEVNPTTGAFIRQVAATPPFPLGLAVDPLSGDLFVSIGQTSNSIYRIFNPGSVSPTIAVYSSVGNADGMAFAPDGTLYTAASTSGAYSIVKIAGTNAGTPGALLASIPSAHSIDGLGLGLGAGGGVLIYANANDGTITKVDPANPSTQPVIYSGGSRGDFATVGPDGCLYATQDDRILKVTNADGSCSLSPGAVQPSLGLSPGAVAPNPAQGGTVTLTASLHNVPSPAGTYITFSVRGANPTIGVVKANAGGSATFTYSGVYTGADTVVAASSPGGMSLTSNLAQLTWTAGTHTSFVSLAGSPTGGGQNQPMTVTANLLDVSANPAVALAGQSLAFSLSDAGGQTCTATTDAAGNASCSVTPTASVGAHLLSVSFTGGGPNLPSSDSNEFIVTAGSKPVLQTVTPANGAAEGGKPISIAGSNIQPGASVSIGGRLAGNIVVGAGGASVSATTPSYLYWGDVNGDTLATVLDALCLLRAIVGLPETPNCPASGFQVTLPLVVSNPGGGSAVVPGGYTYNTGDLTGNGPLSVLDALCLLRSIVGLSATQNCPAPVPPGGPPPGQSSGAPPRSR